MINILLILAGMFIDPPHVLVLTPILWPIAQIIGWTSSLSGSSSCEHGHRHVLSAFGLNLFVIWLHVQGFGRPPGAGALCPSFAIYIVGLMVITYVHPFAVLLSILKW